ncbi:MAG: hypothetical protein R3C26_24725 [Calditrichia bacterium]
MSSPIEFAFDDETIHESHNYVFSETYIQRLIGECWLVSLHSQMRVSHRILRITCCRET